MYMHHRCIVCVCMFVKYIRIEVYQRRRADDELKDAVCVAFQKVTSQMSQNMSGNTWWRRDHGWTIDVLCTCDTCDSFLNQILFTLFLQLSDSRSPTNLWWATH